MIKNSVLLYGIKPETGIMDSVIRGVFAKYSYLCEITSGFDSHGGKISFHNIGWALDYRTKHLPEQIKIQILRECKDALPMFDIGLHSKGTENEHIHSEFDPKNDPVFQAKKVIWKKTGKWPED